MLNHSIFKTIGLLVGILVGLNASLSAQNQSVAINTLLDSLANTFVKDTNNYGIAIGVVQNGTQHTVYKGGKYYPGKADVDSTTLFEIGSITKVYTTYLLASLEAKGVLRRNDLLVKYLPKKITQAKKPWHTKIRLIDLATHTSGLPQFDNTKSLAKLEGFDENDPFGIFTQPMILKLLGEVDATPKYGQVSYSNFGVGVLAYVLEQASGKKYPALFEQYIRKGLKLPNTYVTLPEKQFWRMALPHRQQEAMPLINLADMKAAGGGKTNLSDLLSFLNAHLNPANAAQKSIVKSILATQFKDKKHRLGLGWGKHTIANETVYFHDGGTYGSSSVALLIPRLNVGIAIQTNCKPKGGLNAMLIFLLKKMKVLADKK